MNNQINIKDLLDKTLEGVDITEEEKIFLMGMYMIYYYKYLLEMLLIFKSSDKEFQDRLVNFLDSEIKSLPQDQQQEFQAKVKEDVNVIFSDVVGTFRDNLPENLQQIVDKNINNLPNDKYS